MASVPVPCPASPFEAAPSVRPSLDAASSCSFAPATPSAGSYAAAQASAVPPPAQFTCPPVDKVQPRGCLSCSPEVGAAVGAVAVAYVRLQVTGVKFMLRFILAAFRVGLGA